MIVYRVSKRAHARDLSGEGSRREGGRWNSAGHPMVYTSISRSLALLEVLAHSTILPSGIVLVTLRLPSGARVQKIETADLPVGWDTLPQKAVSQLIGDEFLRAAKFIALRVRSVIIKEEDNILLNPFHPQIRNIEIVSVEDLAVDPRLK
jgi:RES domain-containing protein